MGSPAGGTVTISIAQHRGGTRTVRRCGPINQVPQTLRSHQTADDSPPAAGQGPRIVSRPHHRSGRSQQSIQVAAPQPVQCRLIADIAGERDGEASPAASARPRLGGGGMRIMARHAGRGMQRAEPPARLSGPSPSPVVAQTEIFQRCPPTPDATLDRSRSQSLLICGTLPSGWAQRGRGRRRRSAANLLGAGGRVADEAGSV